MHERDVIVTGLGAVSPMGLGVPSLWSSLVEGRRVTRILNDLPLAADQSRLAAAVPVEVAQLAATHHADHDPAVAYALMAAQEALSQARIGVGKLRPTTLGIVIGTAVGGVISMEREFRRAWRQSRDAVTCSRDLLLGPVSPMLYRQFNAFSVSQILAETLDTHGFVSTMATGCTAGLDAIGLAIDLISCGECEVVISGATEAPLTPIVITAFDNIGALSRRNDDPLVASRPFSKGRDGFVIGEGAGVLVLESRRHAKARGARGLAELTGFSSRSNAFHMTSLHPAGEDLAWCMTDAMRRAGLDASSIGYINAHGTSTPQNDVAETNAIKSALGDRATSVPVSSSKSMLGHALGAASALAVCATIQTLNTNTIHPTANLDVDPLCDLDHVFSARQPKSPVVHAICNASGFSGIHSSLILSRVRQG
ncbi:MAG TPA: beta-ketoacyl-[acyl-carrier-protein] synthase family protein [Burkholderiaceae bacterium]|nr:beta-ketoacyl-[acyl-carrier-protein] synthase family protein [Burkholderiaceae bacterium]